MAFALSGIWLLYGVMAPRIEGRVGLQQRVMFELILMIMCISIHGLVWLIIYIMEIYRVDIYIYICL